MKTTEYIKNSIDRFPRGDVFTYSDFAESVEHKLLGAILCDLGRDEITGKLKKSLNPLTSYTIPGGSEVLSSAPGWSIK